MMRIDWEFVAAAVIASGFWIAFAGLVGVPMWMWAFFIGWCVVVTCIGISRSRL